MKYKNLIPRDKFDTSTISKLEVISDSDFEAIGMEILTWVQDINWPIASEMVRLIVLRQDVMMHHIETVLRGSDEIWKYWIITNIIPNINENNLKKIYPRLLEISLNPTIDEIESGTYEEIKLFFEKT